VDLEKTRREVEEKLDAEIDDEDLMGYMMYPKVFSDYTMRHKDYGPVRTLPTHTFFYGMEAGEEIEAEIDPGVRLVIQLQAIGETNEEGEAKVFFELNGQPRTIRVPNRRVAATQEKRPKAETGNAAHVGAPMPGVVATVSVNPGQKVKQGDLLLTIEAMKMETGIHADHDATVKAVHVSAGAQIDAKDLLIEFED
jgi:pyruvate carboxylase